MKTMTANDLVLGTDMRDRVFTLTVPDGEATPRLLVDGVLHGPTDLVSEPDDEVSRIYEEPRQTAAWWVTYWISKGGDRIVLDDPNYPNARRRVSLLLDNPIVAAWEAAAQQQPTETGK